jgi:Fe-S cluster biogenesis protein NfuA
MLSLVPPELPMMEHFVPTEFHTSLRRLDSLLQDVERLTDPSARAQVRMIVQALLELHGLGLNNLLGHLSAAGPSGEAILDACVRDEVIGGLLLLHGLHPVDLESRVLQALEQVRPALQSHGGDVKLLEVADGVVRLQLQGNCHGCPSSSATMSQTIEQAILGLAPDATALLVEGATPSHHTTADGRPLVVLSAP